MKDYLNTLKTLKLIPATAAASSTVTGTAVDISQLEDGTLKLILDSTAGGSGATMICQLQDSADGSSGWASAPANQLAGNNGLFATVGNAASFQEIGAQIRTLRRYIRIVATIAGSATFTFNVHAIGQLKQL